MLGQMTDMLRRRFASSNRLYTDLASALTSEQLGSKLPAGIKSNTIGAQFWCVVSARKSSAAAVRAGEWQGFTSAMSPEEAVDPEAVTRILTATITDLVGVFDEFSNFTESQERIVLGILEHEAMHHGQLIRYLYALDIERPDSWKRRYSLT